MTRVLRLGLDDSPLWRGARNGRADEARPPAWRGGFAAYRAGDVPRRREGAARGRSARRLRNEDWAAFLLGESEFYDGDVSGRARGVRAGRAGAWRPPSAMAPFRIADCLWMEGDHGGGGQAPTRRSSRRRRPRQATSALARAFGSPRRASARDPARGGEAAPGDRTRIPGAPAGRRGAAPGRRAGGARGDDEARSPPTRSPPPPPPRRRRSLGPRSSEAGRVADAATGTGTRRSSSWASCRPSCRPRWRPSATTRSG